MITVKEISVCLSAVVQCRHVLTSMTTTHNIWLQVVLDYQLSEQNSFTAMRARDKCQGTTLHLYPPIPLPPSPPPRPSLPLAPPSLLRGLCHSVAPRPRY